MSVKLREKLLSNGNKSLYLDIYHNGERTYEFLKIYIEKKESTATRKEKRLLAESVRSKRQLEVNNDEYGFIPSFKRKVDFINYFQHYVDTFEGKGVRKYSSSLLKFKAFYSKKKLPLNSINFKLCKDFCEYLTSAKSGLSGETPFDYFKKFQTVINQARGEGLIKKNPFINPNNTKEKFNISRKSDEIKKEVLSDEELQALASAYCGNEEVKRAFLFACFTGLGLAEIKALKWGDIQNAKIKTSRKKNNKQVIIDLHTVASNLLGTKGKAEELIFSLPSSNGVNKSLKLWTKKAEIEKKITFYCARHTFAIRLLSGGADLKTVANCMGHASIVTTTKYLNYVDKLKEHAISNLPSIDL